MKITLRKYLINRKIELYEDIVKFNNKSTSSNYTEDEYIKCKINEAKIEILNEIIKFCEERKRY